MRPILEDGQEVYSISADVTDEESCAAAADEIASTLGRLHMLIMSAGISEPGEFVRTDLRTWDRVFAVNVRGCRNAVTQMLPLLVAGGRDTPAGSRVCFVSSAAGLTGVYGLSAYCASKFALLGFAQTLQQELLALGVRVGLHFPPDTDTPLLHSENLRKPRLTKEISETIGVEQPEDVARTLVRHSADGLFLSAHDWISWALLLQTAGMSPAPTVGEAVAQTALGGFPLRLLGVYLVAEWVGKVRARVATDVEPAVLGTATAKRLADRAAAGGHGFDETMRRSIEVHQGSAQEAEAEIEEEEAAVGEEVTAEVPSPASDTEEARPRQRVSSGTVPAL